MTLQRLSSLQAAVEVPPAAPLAMPVRPLDAEPADRQPPGPPGLARRRLTVALATAVLFGGVLWAMARGLGRDGFGALDWVILTLFAFNAFWIAFAAVTAAAGLAWTDLGRRAPRDTADWRPNGRTAVLIPARNENVRRSRATSRAGAWRPMSTSSFCRIPTIPGPSRPRSASPTPSPPIPSPRAATTAAG